MQAGRVQGADQLAQTLFIPVHLPVSSHEELPGRHGGVLVEETAGKQRQRPGR